jgi:hypothetical protein
MSTELLSAVLSPESQRTGSLTPASYSMAGRLDTLSGKTVYLVDTGYGGSYKFLDVMQKWFASNMPTVKTVRKRKTGSIFADDTRDLWEEVKAKGHAAILGVAG